MSEKQMCMACDTKVAIFKLTYFEYDGDPEDYCADCTSNIVKETPKDVETIVRIGGM